MRATERFPDCVAENHPDGLWGCECPECKGLQLEYCLEAGGEYD